MSTILDALKKAEQHRQHKQHTQPFTAMPYLPVRKPEVRSSTVWPYWLVIITLLMVIVNGALWWWWTATHNSASSVTPTVVVAPAVQQPLVVTPQQPPQAELVIAPQNDVANDDVAFLPPLSLQTKPLPARPAQVPVATRDIPAALSNVPVTAAGAQGAIDLSGIDEDLARRFEQALLDSSQPEPVEVAPPQGAIVLADLPENIRKSVPALSFDSHVYATNSAKRTVVFNGKSFREGDNVAPNVQLLEITPTGVIMRVGSQSFSLPALEDWQP